MKNKTTYKNLDMTFFVSLPGLAFAFILLLITNSIEISAIVGVIISMLSIIYYKNKLERKNELKDKL